MSDSDEEPQELGFGLFDEFHITEPVKCEPAPRRAASKQELLNLCHFHRNTFAEWPRLVVDAKEHVTSLLEYRDRCHLERCAKSEYAIVGRTPMYVHNVSINDTETNHYQLEKEEFENVVVSVQFDPDYNSGKRFELIFSQLGEHTQIRWTRYNRQKGGIATQSVIRDNCNYYAEAVRFAESWMKRSNFKIAGLTVEMSRYPFERSIVTRLDKCTGLRLGCAGGVDALKWWLSRVPEELEYLDFCVPYESRDTFALSQEIVTLPQVRNVTNGLVVYGRAEFTDEQWLELRAKKIHFDPIRITDEGINAFLKKWASGGGVDGFKESLLWSERVVDQQTLICGLDVQPWDDDFRQQSGGFCGDFDRVCGRGTCFQVLHRHKPFDSLTLCISSDRVSIYATGTEMTWQGETYTNYSIPI